MVIQHIMKQKDYTNEKYDIIRKNSIKKLKLYLKKIKNNENTSN